MATEKDLITETIEDVDKSTTKYIKAHWLFYASTALVCIGAATMIAYYSSDAETAFFPLIILIFVFAKVRDNVQHLFMRQFAAANNFDYTQSGSLSGLDGALFQRGNGRKMTDVVSGRYRDNPIRIFYYEFSTGSGKSRQQHPYTVCEIEYAGSVPSISVDKAGFWDTNEFVTRGQKKLSLNNEFDKHFTLYIQEDYEIEALQIFTPEVAEALIDKAKSFEFGFHGKRVYIYTQGSISTRKRLQDLHALMQYIVKTLSPRIVRLHDDVSAMHEVYAKRGA